MQYPARSLARIDRNCDHGHRRHIDRVAHRPSKPLVAGPQP